MGLLKSIIGLILVLVTMHSFGYGFADFSPDAHLLCVSIIFAAGIAGGDRK